MENIILTNNKDLRLVSVKVGVLSTLRFELPLVSASATHVEVIVTSGGVPSAYTATFIDATKRWQCDIAASQFPTVGKQSYEVAYVLDGKQFWDGKGWIEIEDATTSGIEPQPRPEPYRYAVVSVNGYGADAQGAVRIPKTFIATDSPTTTEGFMEGDIYFNRSTGATWTLCNVQGTLTWVFNYKNYYTKAETDEAIDKLAAYYITYTAAGKAFPTREALLNAETYYSGGAERVPTRNDYAVVLADEAHEGAEYRYIYAVADGATTGQWEAQYPIETNDYTALSNKPQINGNTLTGNKTGADLGVLDLNGGTMTGEIRWGDQGGVAVEGVSGRHSVAITDYYGENTVYIRPTNKTDNAPLASLKDIAPAYKSSTAYVVGQLCIKDDALVKCTTAGTGNAAVFADATVEDVLAALRTALAGKANRAANPTAGNLAALDANGNPTNSTIPAANVALKANIPYTLVTQPIVGNVVLLEDRTSNSVTISATLSPNTLTINFLPTLIGKARDFAMRLNIAAGVTAPEIAWPQGVTLENDGGEVPEIADGGTGGSSTILYFSETENDGTTAKFLVKGETLTAIAQA